MHRENQSEAATVKWPLRSCITEILCTVEFFFGKSSMEFLRAIFFRALDCDSPFWNFKFAEAV